jgi:acetoin utilization protein AcuB
MLTVNDLMTVEPLTVTLETPLREVIQLMKVEGCRQLPVLDGIGKLAGIITDRDVRLAMNSAFVLHERWQDETLLDTATVESCMTPNPLTVTPDTPAYRAAEMLSAYKFGALPVVENGELIGIISVTDFLEQFAADRPVVALTSRGGHL